MQIPQMRIFALGIFNLVLLNVASVRMLPIINTNVANWKLELATLTTLATINNAGSVPIHGIADAAKNIFDIVIG